MSPFYLKFVLVGQEVRNVHGITQVLTYFKLVATHSAAIKDQGASIKHLYVLDTVPSAFTYIVLCNPHKDPDRWALLIPIFVGEVK